jgi:hypothetical protein
MENPKSEDLPLVCQLPTDQLQERRAGLLADLLAHASQCEAQEEGYRFRFLPKDETLATLLAVIRAERLCCAFLRFDLTVEPNHGAIWFTVSGPPGTRAILDQVFQP